VELANLVADVMRILDDAMKLVEKKIEESKDNERTRKAYEDYRNHIRELGTSVYTLIGKMRMDKVLDPPELEALGQMATTGLQIAEEPPE
jgi:hypothetical protein